MGTTAIATDTTGPAGIYSLSVKYGQVKIEASKKQHGFIYPDSNQTVPAAPGQHIAYRSIEANTWEIVGLSAHRFEKPNGFTMSNGTRGQQWHAAVILRTVGDQRVSTAPRAISPAERGYPAGVSRGRRTTFYSMRSGSWIQDTVMFLKPDSLSATGWGTRAVRGWTGFGWVSNPSRDQDGDRFPDDTFTIKIQTHFLTGTSGVNRSATIDSFFVKVPAINSAATSITANRSKNGDSITVGWKTRTNSRSIQRLVFTFPSVADPGWVWRKVVSQ